ncbi:hypothetical protein [Simplicispira piscis]
MHRILKPILLGLLISTSLMATIYVSAVMGSTPAVNLLLEMTLPPFNIAAAFLEPVAPDDLERGGQMIDFMLLVAWVQLIMVAAVVMAGIRVVLGRKPT